ncbi:MAG: HNH endonuclease signature motif containing protein, partial [Candidatus Dormibacteria bacterium]
MHWANGGPTNVTNLALLCGQHHSLIHEGGWSVRGNPEPGPGPDDTLEFVRPDGSVFVPHPALAMQPRWPDHHGDPPPAGRE